MEPKSLFELAHSTVLINDRNDPSLPDHFAEELYLRWPGLGEIEVFKISEKFHIYTAGEHYTAEEACEKAERDEIPFLTKFFKTLIELNNINNKNVCNHRTCCYYCFLRGV